MSLSAKDNGLNSLYYSKDFFDKELSKVDCQCICPLFSYWECKKCKHNCNRFNMEGYDPKEEGAWGR